MNSKSVKPLYQQIEASIRSDIQTHIYKAGDKLPTETELSAKYNVSKITIRKAMEKLSHNGLMQKVQGKGTFVCPQKDKIALSETRGFNDSLSSHGHTSRHKVLEIKKIQSDDRVSEALSLCEGSPVIYVERLIWADNKPIGLDTIYVSEAAFPDFIQKAASEKPLYHILKEDYGLEVAEATLEINGILADSSKASLLKCLVGDPLFYVEKTAYNSDGTPIHFSSTYVRCDSVTYVVRTNQFLHMEEKRLASCFHKRK